MAETALGMATTLVGSALRVASSAAREEMGLLLGVQDDVCFISDELKMMQAFLGAADAAQNTAVLKAYLTLIRDLAYDIEDCFEEFIVFIKNKSLVQQLVSLRARHRIAVQIRSLKKRVQEVTQRNQRYSVGLTASASSDVTGDTELIRNLSPRYVEEAQLFGLDKPKEELRALVTPQKDKLETVDTGKAGPRVVSVVGMGGLGKTTLANNVYHTKDLRDKFDTHAWITVSQIFDRKELLKSMIEQLFGADSLKKFLEEHKGKVLKVHHLTTNLQERLTEIIRYFIVLDDVWTTEAWEFFKLSFPDNSKDGSCVVVTTRNHKLAEHCSLPSHILRPEMLKKEDARRLFLKKTNKSPDDLEKDDHTKGIVEKILIKCGGLPLAIVTIGGLLANKDTKEWENLYNQLPSELATNPSLEVLRQVVHLSYNHMPSHLKPCFLHLSLFPEDFEIERKHLVNRWVAEGFVTNATSRRTLEEVAESYFYELISRSMIQPSKLDVLGSVKTCRVHDIVHDIAVSISSQENHVFLVEEHTSATTASKESIRHVSCFARRKLNSDMDFSRVRSFTMFSKPLQPIASLCSSKYKMLRVLDLKNADFRAEQQDIRNIGLLLHLKYLHFPCRYSRVYALPRSIGRLQSLQTLDIQESSALTLPAEITKLHNLRRLRCSRASGYEYFKPSHYGAWFGDAFTLINLADRDSRNAATADLHMALSRCWSDSSGIKLPKGVGRLKQLQILEKVDIKRTSRKAIKELGELTQLRKLVVRGRGASKRKCNAFCEAAQKLSSLRSLNVSTGYAAERDKEARVLDMLVSFTSPLPSLERLKLKGRLQEIPAWVGKCVNLVKVDLKYCKLKELEALAEMPSLIQLRLYFDAFDAEKLVFRRDAFLKLKILHIYYYTPLREVTFEQSTSPSMETIRIESCELTSGINGIKHLPKLREIFIWRGTLAKQDMLKEEVDNHTNHPVLQIRDTKKPEVNQEVTGSISEQGESSHS